MDWTARRAKCTTRSAACSPGRWPPRCSRAGATLLLGSHVAGDERVGGVAGTIIGVERDALVVATSPGAIRIVRFRSKGAAPVTTARDFLNGRHDRRGRAVRAGAARDMSAARTAAARVLLAVARKQATLADEMERARPDIGDARDRALLLEMVAGTLRWQHALDAVIARGSGRSIDAHRSAAVLAVLRLGAYQLRHLTRIPPHAIVHESVETVRAIGAPHAAGFVNAVHAHAHPTRAATEIARAARRRRADAPLRWRISRRRSLIRNGSCARWLSRYGFEDAERWCAFNNTTPDLTARSAGRVRARGDPRRASPGGHRGARRLLSSPARLVCRPARSIRLSPDLRAELVFQDEPSQLVGRAVGVQPGERVLDLCAAPGGKDAADGVGPGRDRPLASPPIIASDRRPKRVALLSRRSRAALHPVLVVALDASEAAALRRVVRRGAARCALLGSRHAAGAIPISSGHARNRTWQDSRRPRARMLRQAANVVRPGGRLVYADLLERAG